MLNRIELTHNMTARILLPCLGVLFCFVALGAPGDLDDSFHAEVESPIYASALQTDGRVLVAAIYPDGTTSRPDLKAQNTNALVRLNADGSQDRSFKALTISQVLPSLGESIFGILNAVFPQADGKILVGGEFDTLNGSPQIKLARLESDGGLDTSFKPEALPRSVETVAVQPDGKIVVAGVTRWEVGEPGIFRLESDGRLDPVFQSPYEAIHYEAVIVQPDGKVLIGGYIESVHGVPRHGVARLNANGTLDSTFINPQVKFGYQLSEGGRVSCIAVQPDGKILIGGEFNRVGGVSRKGIARLNADGSLDPVFNSGPGLPRKGYYGDSYVNSIVLQPDGKMLIGGYFDSYNGMARTNIARLNTDGTLDVTFNTSSVPALRSVSTIIVQADGTLLISGFPRNGIHNVSIFRIYGGEAAPDISISRTGTSPVLSWPLQGTDGYELESADALSGGKWKPEAAAALAVGDRYLLPIDETVPARFYRLRKE